MSTNNIKEKALNVIDSHAIKKSKDQETQAKAEGGFFARNKKKILGIGAGVLGAAGAAVVGLKLLRGRGEEDGDPFADLGFDSIDTPVE